ncbi:MAG TPA: hypothetical protein VN957_29670 [Chthoniobacterales bacterium]|nr:hypothetical protein [Chthoniobacterales bacterium]
MPLELAPRPTGINGVTESSGPIQQGFGMLLLIEIGTRRIQSASKNFEYWRLKRVESELERLTMISSSYARSWLLASDTYGRFDMSISVPDTNSDYERARKPQERSERGAAQVRR